MADTAFFETASPYHERWDQSPRRGQVLMSERRHFDTSSHGSAAGIVHQNEMHRASQSSLAFGSLPTVRQPFLRSFAATDRAATMPVHAFRKLDVVAEGPRPPTSTRPAIQRTFPGLAGRHREPQWNLSRARSQARAAAYMASQPRLTKGVLLPQIPPEHQAHATYYKECGSMKRLLQ